MFWRNFFKKKTKQRYFIVTSMFNKRGEDGFTTANFSFTTKNGGFPSKPELVGETITRNPKAYNISVLCVVEVTETDFNEFFEL